MKLLVTVLIALILALAAQNFVACQKFINERFDAECMPVDRRP